jgi:hypothetical protein
MEEVGKVPGGIPVELAFVRITWGWHEPKRGGIAIVALGKYMFLYMVISVFD